MLSNQYGFTPRKPTTYVIENVSKILQKHRKNRDKACVTSLEIKEASGAEKVRKNQLNLFKLVKSFLDNRVIYYEKKD